MVRHGVAVVEHLLHLVGRGVGLIHVGDVDVGVLGLLEQQPVIDPHLVLGPAEGDAVHRKPYSPQASFQNHLGHLYRMGLAVDRHEELLCQIRLNHFGRKPLHLLAGKGIELVAPLLHSPYLRK